MAWHGTARHGTHAAWEPTNTVLNSKDTSRCGVCMHWSRKQWPANSHYGDGSTADSAHEMLHATPVHPGKCGVQHMSVTSALRSWWPPFLSTQEFTSAYRMHMLVPDGFTVRGVDGSNKGHIWTGDTVMAGARAVMVGGLKQSVLLCWPANGAHLNPVQSSTAMQLHEQAGPNTSAAS